MKGNQNISGKYLQRNNVFFMTQQQIEEFRKLGNEMNEACEEFTKAFIAFRHSRSDIILKNKLSECEVNLKNAFNTLTSFTPDATV